MDLVVSPASRRPDCEVYPVGLRERLPIVAIPLRGDESAPLDLQAVVETAYRPERYFGRVARVGKRLDSRGRRYRPGLKRWAKELQGFARMAVRMTKDPESPGPFWRTFLGGLVGNPRSVRYIGMMCGLYVHFGPFSQFVASKIRAAIAEAERQPPSAPPALPPSLVTPRAVTADPA